MDEAKSVRSRRVGRERGVCGVARLDRGARHGLRRAPCIRSLSRPTRLTWITQTGSLLDRAGEEFLHALEERLFARFVAALLQ